MREIQLTGKWAAQWPVAHVADRHFNLLSPYTWRVRYRPVGSVARNAKGDYIRRTPDGPYSIASIKGKTVLMHRMIAAAEGYDWKIVDHSDHDTLNNDIANLRDGTKGNTRFKCPLPGSSSRYMGVTWATREGRWQAQISANGQHKSLGYHESEIEAAKAYDQGALKYLTPAEWPFVTWNFPVDFQVVSLVA